jgi:hypothetical protein
MALTGRVLPWKDYYITSGAIMPLPKPVIDTTVMPLVQKLLQRRNTTEGMILTPGEESIVSAQIIRAALRANALKGVEYQSTAR